VLLWRRKLLSSLSFLLFSLALSRSTWKVENLKMISLNEMLADTALAAAVKFSKKRKKKKRKEMLADTIHARGEKVEALEMQLSLYE
jgi:hypothetical protein